MNSTQTAGDVQTFQPKEYVSCVDTAKALRLALKAQFPGVKFFIHSKTYSGGASITVSWTDGPTAEVVDLIAGQFAGCTFDGSIDLKEYHTSEYQGRRVQWGANFVFTSRHQSAELVDRACTYVEANYGITHIDRATYYNDYRPAYRGNVGTLVNFTLYHMRGDGVIVTVKGR